MSDEKFRLPKSSYDELVKIIKGYGHLTVAANLEEISKTVAVNPTLISANAGFLLGTNIIEPGSKKKATSNGRELARALEHEMPDEIRRWWRTIVAECEFLSRLLSAIKIRKGMDETTLQAHIAYSAGVQKTPAVMTGARTVVDILRAAELIKEQDGKLTMVESVPTDGAIVVTGTQPPSMEGTLATTKNRIVQGAEQNPRLGVNIPNASGVAISLNIEVRVNCEAKELDGLGTKLRTMIEEVTSASGKTTAASSHQTKV